MNNLLHTLVAYGHHPDLGDCQTHWGPWSLSMQLRPVYVLADLGALACYVNAEGMLISPVACLDEPGAQWEPLTPDTDMDRIGVLGAVVQQSFVALTLGGTRIPGDMPNCSLTNVG